LRESCASRAFVSACSSLRRLKQFLESSHPDAVKGTYGENFDRLVEIKNKYDPDNFFKHSVWPSGKGERETGNALMGFAVCGEAASGQQRKLAEEDSKIGMEGVEAIAQMAEERSLPPGRVTRDIDNKVQHNPDGFGILE
jgi:hypothetical protein